MSEVTTVEVTEAQTAAPMLPTLASALNMQSMPNIGGVSGYIEVQRAVAEVQTAVLAAMAMPRDENVSRQKLLRACQCLPLAKKALWGEGKGIARGSEKIHGPSIHLAKEIARVWRNIDYALIEHSASLEESEYEALAWDKEANTKSYVRFKVQPIRYSNGAKLTRPADIRENAFNIGARILRSVILSLIPAYIVEEAQEACKATIAAAITNVEEDKKKMLLGFAKHRVNQIDLEQYVEKSWDAITVQDVADLQMVYAALRANEAKPEDFFTRESTAIATKPEASKPAEKATEKPPDKPAAADKKADAKKQDKKEAAPPPAVKPPETKPPNQPVSSANPLPADLDIGDSFVV